ncbi:MAG: DUF6282 family protein [Anaerolineales bacterium]|jgi:hypothetical protein
MNAIDDLWYDLDGLIDMHIHTAPDVRPRYANDIQTVREAKDAGMAAILIKSHQTLTADRAKIAEDFVGGIRVFGGLALNDAIGGLNPFAAEIAIKLGAKEIWLPTRSAAQARKNDGLLGGITITTDDGRLKCEVQRIIELIRDADVILASGHISPAETVQLVKVALEMGLRKIVVTHPEAHFTWMPIEIQKELASDGVFFERCYVDTTPTMNSTVTISEIAVHIKEVGAHSTVVSTDFGQAISPPPVDGMRAYLAKLSQHGISREEIKKMAGDNPSYLLDI